MRTFLICGRATGFIRRGVIAVVAAWLLILTASVLDQAALAQALGAIPYIPAGVEIGGNPDQGFDPQTKENFAWDREAHVWRNTKTGKAVGSYYLPGSKSYVRREIREGGIPYIPAGVEIGGNPDQGFDPQTKENFAWDREAHVWRNTKTGKAVGSYYLPGSKSYVRRELREVVQAGQGNQKQVGIRTTEPKTNVGSAAPKTCGDIRDRETALAMGCIQDPQSEAKGATANNTGTNPKAQATAGCLVARLNQEQVTLPLSLRSPELGPPADSEKRSFAAAEGTFGGGPNNVQGATPNCPPSPLNPEAGFQGGPSLPSSCRGVAGVNSPGRVCADGTTPAVNAVVPISPRSPQLSPPSDAEKRTFPATEGRFGGGTYTSPPGR